MSAATLPGGWAAALVLLAAAVLLVPGRIDAACRVAALRPTGVTDAPDEVVVPASRGDDPVDVAGAWDLVAAGLRAGLAVEPAVRAVAPLLPADAAAAIGRVADLLALGADPAEAWAAALDEPTTARLARAARRSARSGAALAEVAAAVAADVRGDAADVVAARAERAGVLVTGPLGLCFLPAFLALGIVPVVIGLAGPLLDQR